MYLSKGEIGSFGTNMTSPLFLPQGSKIGNSLTFVKFHIAYPKMLTFQESIHFQ